MVLTCYKKISAVIVRVAETLFSFLIVIKFRILRCAENFRKIVSGTFVNMSSSTVIFR